MMWKSLDNALLICELFLLVAAIVTCAAEVTDYSKVSFFNNILSDLSPILWLSIIECQSLSHDQSFSCLPAILESGISLFFIVYQR